MKYRIIIEPKNEEDPTETLEILEEIRYALRRRNPLDEPISYVDIIDESTKKTSLSEEKKER